MPEWPSYTIKEASQKTGYNGEYLRRLIRQGKIEAIKVGQQRISLHEQAPCADKVSQGGQIYNIIPRYNEIAGYRVTKAMGRLEVINLRLRI